MNLEITIKVPVGAAGVSVEQSTASGVALPEEGAHWPPSPVDFGSPATSSAAELAPPPLEMIEELAARSATTNGPPGLEDLPLNELVAGGEDALAEPPDLPDSFEVPTADD